MSGVLISEWVKIRSMNATWRIPAILIVTILIAAVLTWRGVQSWEALDPGRQALFRQATMAQIVTPILHLCIAVFGVLTITSEYASGTICASLIAVPNRMSLFFGKVVIASVLSLLLSFAVLGFNDALSAAVIGDRPYYVGYSPAGSRGFLALLVHAFVGMVIAMVGLGLGTVLRSSAAALISVNVLLFMPSVLVNYIPKHLGLQLAAISMSNLAEQIVDGPGALGVLTPLGATATAMAYGAVALCLGGLRLTRSDA